MAIQIVTGRTGEPHLDIYELSALLRKVCASDSNTQVLVFEPDNALSLSTEGNSVKVEAGDFLMQGAFMRVPQGQTVTATGTLAANATQAILYIHYEQDVNTGIDSAEFGIYNGSYTDFKNEYPSSYLETGSKEIYVAIYSIEYRNNGDQSELISKTFTPESKIMRSMKTLKAIVDSLSDVLYELRNNYNTFKEDVKRQLSGIVVFTPARAGVYYDQTITLPNNFFTNKPKIMLTPITSQPDKVHIGVKSYSKNNFTITFKRDDAASQTSVHWTATE